MLPACKSITQYYYHIMLQLWFSEFSVILEEKSNVSSIGPSPSIIHRNTADKSTFNDPGNVGASGAGDKYWKIKLVDM